MSLIPGRFGQQQRQQYRAALAVDHAVDHFGTEPALEGADGLLRLLNVIAETLQREHEGAVAP